MIITPDTVIAIAEEEVGYLEKSWAAYNADRNCIYSKKDGAGRDNITKYGYDMHKICPAIMDFPAFWCDAFVDWCFYKAYGETKAKELLCGGFDDYTVNSAKKFKNKMRWSRRPSTGAQIFFTNGTRICHTGIVYKVDARYVYTIEGNTSDKNVLEANGGCVAKKKYSLNHTSIAGYGLPLYDVPATCAMGDENDDVLLLQRELIAKGYALPQFGADGDFGNETANAVKKFRADHKLKVSGMCDAECWSRLLA